MKSEKKYIYLLVGVFLLYVGFKLFSPTPIDWRVSFHKSDKNPFGLNALSRLAVTLFPDQKITIGNQTAYEIYDTIATPVNLISFSTYFNAEKADAEAILKNVERGGHALIGAEYWNSLIADTLGLESQNMFFWQDGYRLNREDTAAIRFVNRKLPQADFMYSRLNTNQFFSSFDSSRVSVVAVNDQGMPVVVKARWGKGNLVLTSVPLVFTNLYAIGENHPEFIEGVFSFLPQLPVRWTEYYHNGRLESDSMLRFILTNETLRWAYVILALSLLTYIVFKAKRTQRVVPVIKPLENTTLEFVQTIGNLYFQTGDHKNIAEKKILIFFDQLRTKYWLRSIEHTPGFINTLARKSGHSPEELEDLFQLIKSIQKKSAITEEELIRLNFKIEHFNRQQTHS